MLDKEIATHSLHKPFMITPKETIVNNRKINSITFQVEELEKPKKLLREKSYDRILAPFSGKIEKSSLTESSLVPKGYHSFIAGMYQAYVDHRPFVMSPDMIWLLICQGFSHHVRAMQGTADDLFPSLAEKEPLIVKDRRIQLGDPNSPWEEMPRAFVQKIAEYVGEDLIDVLSANFSTTGLAEKMATEITIMDAMKPYFKYIFITYICGIPQITLEGKAEDWAKIIDKLTYLKQFRLDWWVDELVPIIQEFVHAFQGKINKEFWMNMFKIHTEDSYGHPKTVDGWITHFYPYDRDGKRIDWKKLKEIKVEELFERLPKETACVDFILRIEDGAGNLIEEVPMEYWAGFLGLSQNHKPFALRPEIGWIVGQRPSSKIKYEGPIMRETNSREYYNLSSFPAELFEQKMWNHLILNFNREIKIPQKLSGISISMLELNGKISAEELNKLKECLSGKKTWLLINGEEHKWE